MVSRNRQLEEVVGERLGAFTAKPGKRDGLQVTSKEGLHEILLLAGCKFSENAVALASHLHR